jgi:outer membrane autotransporter protein
MTRNGNEGAADGSVSTVYAGVVAAWRLSARRGNRVRFSPPLEDATGRGALRFGLLHGWHNLAATRAVRAGGLRSNVSARYGARSVQAFSELTWRWAWRGVQRFTGMLSQPEYALEPYLRLSHVSLRTNAFTESGGAAALSVQDSRQDVTYSRLGVRAQSHFETATGRARASLDVSWRHAFGALQTRAFQSFRDSAVPTVFGSSGQPVLANAFQIALNVTGRLTRRARLSFGYAALFGAGTQDHGIQAALQVAF